jgi:serine/threonine-protein kinase
VVGLPVSEAYTALINAKLKVRQVDVFSDKPFGTVTGQSPAPDQVVISGSPVRINVSRGLRTVGVISVVGEQYENAAGALQGAGFDVVRTDVDSDEPKGTVVAQSPSAGSSVAKGTKITLSVSKGPVTADVPDVTRQTLADAQATLEEAGFKTTVVPEDVTDPSQDGLVLSQDPAGGPHEKGTTVTLIVGRLVTLPPEEIPTETDTTATTTTTSSPTAPTPP